MVDDADSTQPRRGVPHTEGWFEPPERVVDEETRFAVVLNGGVSLAVWMGGAVCEIDALTRLGHPVYARLLETLHADARVDVIAGASAGGISGAVLALSQVYADAEAHNLRALWAKRGDFRELLQDPWAGDASSLLRGDDYFLPALRAAFDELVPPAGVDARSRLYAPDSRPIDLTLTTTLLDPIVQRVTDALGVTVVQPSHKGQFNFRRQPPAWVDEPRDDFAPATLNGLAAPLALASRCTASFPVAFEPVFVTVEPPEGPEMPLPPGPDAMHPNMQAYAKFPVSRWVVDGGVLANTPLRPVMRAIQDMPADRQVRRVLLALVPDPFVAPGSDDEPSASGDRPTLRAALLKVAMASMAQNVADELDEIQSHNRAALTRRTGRIDVLAGLLRERDPSTSAVSGSDLATLGERLVRRATQLFDQYRDRRIRRAARDVSALADIARSGADALVDALAANMLRARDLPFVPSSFPGVAADGSWSWGAAAQQRLAATVQDLLKRAIWVLPAGAERNQIVRLRGEMHAIRARIAAAARRNEQYWVNALGSRQESSRTDVAAALMSEASWEQWQQQRPYESIESVLQILRLGRQAAGLVPTSPALEPGDASLLGTARFDLLRAVFLAADDYELLQRALALEVCYTCGTDLSESPAEDVVELVQVSSDIKQPFAGAPLDPHERVAGLRLAHFAAFLKESWRVNDWIWGRMDAANRLVATLLDPARLRRLVLLGEPAHDVLSALVGDAPVGPAGSSAALDVLEGRVAGDAARAALQPLADALVVQVCVSIIAEEEQALAEAVEADRANGANPDSPGERWLSRSGLRRERPGGPQQPSRERSAP